VPEVTELPVESFSFSDSVFSEIEAKPWIEEAVTMTFVMLFQDLLDLRLTGQVEGLGKTSIEYLQNFADGGPIICCENDLVSVEIRRKAAGGFEMSRATGKPRALN
jgi:hypothetical protein